MLSSEGWKAFDIYWISNITYQKNFLNYMPFDPTLLHLENVTKDEGTILHLENMTKIVHEKEHNEVYNP